MFKSIQWKIVAMFVAVMIAVITVIGSFLMVNIVDLYNQEFSVMMRQVFTEEFVSQLEQASEGEDGLGELSNMVRSYIGQLGIDTYRFYCILDAGTGDVLKTSDPVRSDGLEKTDNIITAMTGEAGDAVYSEKNYMDYAVSLKNAGEPKYIVYIKDTKEEIQGMTQRVFWIIIQALVLSVLIAVILGYLLSRTITIPIINVTKRAEKLASGEFENIAVSHSNDEIGRLSNTFRFMSSTLHDTIEEVKSEKTKVETILQNMTDGILAFDLDGSLIHMNPEAKRILDIQETDNILFDEFFGKINADITMGDLVYIKQTTPLEREVCINGSQYVKLNFAPTEIDGKVNGIVVVIHDITIQQNLEFSRREFVANVSHELRTPLTTIKSYAETLLDSADTPTESKFLSVIEAEADRMTRIVKDLLTLSHLDNTDKSVNCADLVDVRPFLESVLAKIKINADNKRQTITYTPINDVPPLKTNKDRLEQVIVNIISNAIKYTPEEGHIEIFSSRVYNDLLITVIDNGIGIPEENLPRIFERFYRVDKARSRETGGTGLGLAIAKQIVESFGGKINITSKAGKGTEVNISLPI